MIEFTIPAMTCGNCIVRVTHVIEAADPAAKVEVDLATKHVRIDSSKTVAIFDAALKVAGYPPAA